MSRTIKLRGGGEAKPTHAVLGLDKVGLEELRDGAPVLHFRARCHPASSFLVKYVSDLGLLISCSTCNKGVASVLPKDREPEPSLGGSEVKTPPSVQDMSPKARANRIRALR